MPREGTPPGRAREGLSAARELALVSALYLLLAAVLTYPTVLRLGSHIPGAWDAPRMLWDFWAFYRAATDPQVSLSTTDLLFHPLPDVPNMWISPGGLLLSFPLIAVLGPLLTYNLSFLASFVLAGLFGYLLVRHLSRNKVASLAAGSMLSFSAYHYAHGLGHFGLFCIEWLPLCALCLLRYYANPDFPRAVQFVVAACLVVLSFAYFGAYFLLPLLVCFFLYYLWRERSRVLRPRFVAGIVLALALAGGAVLLFYANLLLPEEEMAMAFREAATDTEKYSADLLAYVLPSATHPVLGELVAPTYDAFSAPESPAEMTIYLGLVALLLALWGLRSSKGVDAPFWAVLALVALVFSLGPVLHVGGQALFPLPYALMMKLPFFGTLRAPSRASATVMLSVSVLAGYGLSDLLGRVGDRAISKVVTVAAVVLLASFESLLSFPYLSSSTAVPVFYEQMLDGPERGALFELPSGPGHNESTGWYMLYQTYHGKKLAHGYLSRDPLRVVLFPHWVLRGKFLSPPVALFDTDTWPAFEASYGDILAYNDIRYVIVRQEAGPYSAPYSDGQYRETKASLTRSLGEPFYEDDGLTAHVVPPRAAEIRASFGAQVELVDHQLVRTTSCPEETDDCTFLVTFWQTNAPVDEIYGLFLGVNRQGRDRVLADSSHGLGYQFTFGEEVATYISSWWGPGVVVADYTLLPSRDSEGALLSGPLDIRIFVADPETHVRLEAQSDYYAIDDQGRILIASYSP